MLLCWIPGSISGTDGTESQGTRSWPWALALKRRCYLLLAGLVFRGVLVSCDLSPRRHLPGGRLHPESGYDRLATVDLLSGTQQ